MTLILTNEEIESCFTLEECFRALEPAFIDLGNGAAANLPRQDLLVPGPLEGSYHGLKSAGGSIPRFGVTAARLTSDIVTWPEVDGERRRVKVPLAMGNKYVGLVFLFSTATGELLAIFPDGLVQAIRVGVTNALSAKYMGRPESSVLGLYGSGWQARAGLLAMCSAMPIRQVRVFSPTVGHRRRFADEMNGQVNAEVRTVDTPADAAHGADIVLLATNALVPFFPADWIHDGMHIATVRLQRDDRGRIASLRPGGGVQSRGGPAGDAARGGRANPGGRRGRLPPGGVARHRGRLEHQAGAGRAHGRQGSDTAESGRGNLHAQLRGVGASIRCGGSAYLRAGTGTRAGKRAAHGVVLAGPALVGGDVVRCRITFR